MKTGIVKNIVLDRGFGFIGSPGQRDIFFHCSQLVALDFDEQLLERRVSFEVATTEKGPRAINVRPE